MSEESVRDAEQIVLGMPSASALPDEGDDAFDRDITTPMAIPLPPESPGNSDFMGQHLDGEERLSPLGKRTLLWLLTAVLSLLGTELAYLSWDKGSDTPSAAVQKAPVSSFRP